MRAVLDLQNSARAERRALPSEPFPVVAYGSRATLARVSDVTRILEAAQQGDPTAAEQLLPLVLQ